MQPTPTSTRDAPIVLAVDIGGTKLAAAVVDAAGGVLAEDRAPTEGSDAEDLFGNLCSLVDRVAARSPAPATAGSLPSLHPRRTGSSAGYAG